jgi:aldose sugar dehydrogenase
MGSGVREAQTLIWITHHRDAFRRADIVAARRSVLAVIGGAVKRNEMRIFKCNARNCAATMLSRAAFIAILILVSGEPYWQSAYAADDNTQSAPATCKPLETREPNAPAQRPAFAGQTRVCAIASNVAFDVVVLAKGLEHPWAVEPLAGGDLLITERPGRLRIVTPAGKVGPPIRGLPAVDARGQGGLLDVAISPQFDSDRTLYWSYSEPREGGNATSVARGVLSADRTSIEQVRVIFRAMPTYDGALHFGSRLAFGSDKMLYITLGERSDAPMRPQAQQLDSDMGKIVRIGPDGSIPKDNPFVGRSNARGEIWTLGHRNVQAAAFDAQGRLWEIEHGTQGGDELNLIEKGKNYGWPLVAYGEEYSGAPIPGAVTARAGFEQPVYYWDPVIAPSGAQFYTGDAFPAWRGSLFIGSLKEKRLVRLTIDNARVTGEEHLLVDRAQRVRDVRQGPDGALYVVTDEAKGEVWKIAPPR